MEVRERTVADEAAVAAFLQARNARLVARLGVLEDALAHPALLAIDGDALAAVLTYVPGDGEVEILTLHTATRLRGTGTALVDAVAEIARRRGSRLWVLTTNDNLDALRFYQRRGFRIQRVIPSGVDQSRAQLKPEIPTTGDYGIPIRDEIILERK